MTDAYASSKLIDRISTVIQDIDLDCECRARVRDALTRFDLMERGRRSRRALTTARDQRDCIAGLMALLTDLEEIGWDEKDGTIYGEIADLFDDIAVAARSGGEAIRMLSTAKRSNRSGTELFRHDADT
ncbi:MAG: hypothetical protein U1E62_06725 [Alsobacter sp.]